MASTSYLKLLVTVIFTGNMWEVEILVQSQTRGLEKFWKVWNMGLEYLLDALLACLFWDCMIEAI